MSSNTPASSTPSPSSSSSNDTSSRPSIPLKKKGKKKKIKVKPVIPTSLTANLGETEKKEREGDPEIFENSTTKPKRTPSKTDESSSSQNSGSSNSAESLTKSITNSTQSLQKLPPRPSKCIHDEAHDKIIEYKIDVGKTYSQSSGTLSYDSVFVAEEGKVNTYRAVGTTTKPVDVKFESSKIIDLNAKKHLEEIKPFEEEGFRKLVYAKECPKYSVPTPEYQLGRREQQLTKEAILEAVEEYFSVPRDDMDLMIRVQRQQAFPILDIKVTPNSRTNFISTGAPSSSQYPSSSSSLSSTSIVDPEGALDE